MNPPLAAHRLAPITGRGLAHRGLAPFAPGTLGTGSICGVFGANGACPLLPNGACPPLPLREQFYYTKKPQKFVRSGSGQRRATGPLVAKNCIAMIHMVDFATLQKDRRGRVQPLGRTRTRL